YYAGEAFRQKGLAAFARRDYLACAEHHDRALLRVLHPNTNFHDTASNLTVALYVHRQRARGLAAAGRLDEALAEAVVCLDLHPLHTELPIALVPELEKRGRKKEAEEMFARASAEHEKLCRAYPQSAWAHNLFAW